MRFLQTFWKNMLKNYFILVLFVSCTANFVWFQTYNVQNQTNKIMAEEFTTTEIYHYYLSGCLALIHPSIHPYALDEEKNCLKHAVELIRAAVQQIDLHIKPHFYSNEWMSGWMEASNRNITSLASLLFGIGTDVFLITAKQVAMHRLKQQPTFSINNELPSIHLLFLIHSSRFIALCI